MQNLKIVPILLISTFTCLLKRVNPEVVSATGLAAVPSSVFEGPTGLSASILSWDAAVSLTDGGSATSEEQLFPDPLNAICASDPLPPDVPQPANREKNIEELELVLRDTGLERAADRECAKRLLQVVAQALHVARHHTYPTQSSAHCILCYQTALNPFGYTNPTLCIRGAA